MAKYTLEDYENMAFETPEGFDDPRINALSSSTLAAIRFVKLYRDSADSREALIATSLERKLIEALENATDYHYYLEHGDENDNH